jgi:hypothetical protein
VVLHFYVQFTCTVYVGVPSTVTCSILAFFQVRSPTKIL